MKRIFTFIGCLTLAATMQTKAQSQRLVLVEEFTNASCPPCAAQNPTFNTLLANNTVKVVSIKYQTNWPGVDPMNAQTQAEVGPRVTYYGVTGVPYSPIDGDVNIAAIGGYYQGAPHNIVQSTIDTKYAIPATHDIALTHAYSSDYDSIYVTMNITCTQTGTGNLKARIALVEKEISFPSAPGTNGETDFYYVMRKMYPNAAGTTVTADTLGETQSIVLGAATPLYTYNINELAVVGFIQNDANKAIKQAAFSDVITLADMVGIDLIDNVPTVQCITDYYPDVTISNKGTSTLTSCNVNYQFDGGTETTIPWTGSIAAGGTAVFTLPQITATAGGHTLKISASNPNNSGFAAPLSFTYSTKGLLTATNYTLLPYTQNFAATSWPPVDWALESQDATQSWSRKAGTGATGSVAGSAKIDFYNSPSGQSDDMFITPLDLTGAIAPAALDFKVAHRQYSAAESDKLYVHVSTDCGANWTQVFLKQGAALSTVAGYVTSAFTPASTQWRAESVNLDNYIGQAQLLVRFRGTSNYGNNAYVDDINFHDATLGLATVSAGNAVFSAYQTSENYVSVKLNLEQADEVTFEVYDILGKKVDSESKGKLSAGDQSFAYNISELSSGVYVVRATIGTKVLNQKININK